MHERRSTCEENTVHQAHGSGQQQRAPVLREAGGKPPALLKMIRHDWLILAIVTLLSPGLSYGGGGGVQGTVQYRGEKVPGAYVELFDTSKPDAEAVDSTNTGSDGRYTVSLRPGSYRLTAKKRPEGPGSGGMLFGSTGKDHLQVGGTVLSVPVIQLKDSGVGEGIAGEIQVSGSVHGPVGPLSGAYVYFYPDGTRRGPGYLARARTGENGRFKAGLAPGTYLVTVRFGISGDGIGSNGMGSDGMGSVGVGDLVGDYRSNPLLVGSETLELGKIELRPVDPETWEQKQWAGVQGNFKVNGLVVKEDRSPMAGAYVFLYDDRRMVGKPVSISAPTAGDGQYSVTVSRPGTYYLGARTRFGGPVEPGEFMGAWDEKGPRPVTLEGKTTSANCDIVVREVW
jgi:hypothetical protein